MRTSALVHASVLVGVVVVLSPIACSNDDEKGKAGEGGSSGSAGQGAAGEGGTGTGGNAAQGGAQGGKGGSSGAGGSSKGGGAGAAAGGDGIGGDDGEGGDSGSGAADAPLRKQDLLGPVMDNESPSELPLAAGICSAPFVDAFVDSEGSAYLLCGNGIAKLDDDLALDWRQGGSVDLFNAAIPVPAGGIIATGRTVQGDVLVVRYAADGTEDWREGWASSGVESADAATIGEDGNLYVTGTSSGQAPGNPPASAGGRWIARYALDTGERALLKQHAPSATGDVPLPGGFHSAALDGEPVLFLFGGMRQAPITSVIEFRAFDLDGNEVSVNASRTYPNATCRNGFGFSKVVKTSEDGSFFTAGSGLGSQAPTIPFCVANYLFTAAGTWRWWNAVAEPARTSIIDETEGVEWTGEFARGFVPAIAVGDDAIFLLGRYSNRYENGSDPPPASNPAFVARYSFEGERVWFRQFVGGEGLLTLAPDDELIVAVAGIRVLRLDATDGSILN